MVFKESLPKTEYISMTHQERKAGGTGRKGEAMGRMVKKKKGGRSRE